MTQMKGEETDRLQYSDTMIGPKLATTTQERLWRNCAWFLKNMSSMLIKIKYWELLVKELTTQNLSICHHINSLCNHTPNTA